MTFRLFGPNLAHPFRKSSFYYAARLPPPPPPRGRAVRAPPRSRPLAPGPRPPAMASGESKRQQAEYIASSPAAAAPDPPPPRTPQQIPAARRLDLLARISEPDRIRPRSRCARRKTDTPTHPSSCKGLFRSLHVNAKKP
ncbi:hypothetical protein PVAP13_4NG215511 [Panicum virgatum]|uniref:Uncharacterized protein n=1 Tax=Panicum virgatum TaxID=38727 RepID=A0A8T0TBY8_PANVG|nr:hypothetical protein PVAP13_4NG215511 [Panicum virgatum]